MNTQQRAADLLWQTVDRGEVLQCLPDDLRPATRAEGYAIQARLPSAARAKTCGWKIAATSAAGRAHIGVRAPLAGRILAPFMHATGAVLPTHGNRMRVAELEFAFVIGRLLAPRDRAYPVQEVLDAVSELRPAIELPSSRFADFVRAGEPQLIADLACAGRFVFGDPAPQAWRSLDLRAQVVHGTVRRGATVALERSGLGETVLGDPRLALAWLVNELSALNIALDEGQIVSTGTCLAPMAIEPGDVIEGDFGTLGSVGAQFGQNSP